METSKPYSGLFEAFGKGLVRGVEPDIASPNY